MPTTGEAWQFSGDDDEADVPEVCFGVMECVVRDDVGGVIVDKWATQ
jgi:hypothetical protein